MREDGATFWVDLHKRQIEIALFLWKIALSHTNLNYKFSNLWSRVEGHYFQYTLSYEQNCSTSFTRKVSFMSTCAKLRKHDTLIIGLRFPHKHRSNCCSWVLSCWTCVWKLSLPKCTKRRLSHWRTWKWSQGRCRRRWKEHSWGRLSQSPSFSPCTPVQICETFCSHPFDCYKQVKPGFTNYQPRG